MPELARASLGVCKPRLLLKTCQTNMKKNYITPCMETTTLRSGALLEPSVTADDIRHGGTDDGTHEADSRGGSRWVHEADSRRGNVWDSEFE